MSQRRSRINFSWHFFFEWSGREVACGVKKKFTYRWILALRLEFHHNHKSFHWYQSSPVPYGRTLGISFWIFLVGRVLVKILKNSGAILVPTFYYCIIFSIFRALCLDSLYVQWQLAKPSRIFKGRKNLWSGTSRREYVTYTWWVFFLSVGKTGHRPKYSNDPFKFFVCLNPE